MLLAMIGAGLFLCGVLLAYWAGRRTERVKHEWIAEQRRYRWRPAPGLLDRERLTVADEDTALSHRIAQLRMDARVAQSLGGRRP